VALVQAGPRLFGVDVAVMERPSRKSRPRWSLERQIVVRSLGTPGMKKEGLVAESM